MSNNIYNEKKREKADGEKLNDIAVNRVMLLFTLSVAVVIILSILRKVVGTNSYFFVLYVLPYLQIAAALLVVGAGIWYFVRRKNKVDERYKFIKSSYILGIAITMLVSALLYKFIGVTGIIIIVIAAMVLCYVFNFYSRDFFAYSIVTALGAIMLYVAGLGKSQMSIYSIAKIAISAFAIVFAIAVIIITAIMRKNGGKLGIGGKNVVTMHNGSKYYPFFIAAGIILAGTVAALVFSFTSIYSICVLFAAYLVIAIVYSIKMI